MGAYIASDVKEAVLAAVRENGLPLKSAPEFLKADKDVVLAAVKQNALQFAAENLKGDEGVIRATVKQWATGDADEKTTLLTRAEILQRLRSKRFMSSTPRRAEIREHVEQLLKNLSPPGRAERSSRKLPASSLVLSSNSKMF